MTNPNITQNDAMKLAIASITICLLLNLALTGFILTNIDGIWLNDNLQYDSNYISILTTQVPTPIYCITGDETCTNQLTNVPAEDTNQFDKLQSLVNVGALVANAIVFIGMTPLMPLYIKNVLLHFITNAWLIGVIIIITTMWTMLNIYAIIKFFFKK